MKKTLMIAIAGIGLTAGGVAAAQDMPRGDVTRADAEARAAAAFERMDVTGDGILNAEDREAHALERFNSADANGDGLLSFEEIQAQREERRATMEERRAERGERGERGERRPRMGRRGGATGQMRGMMQRADSDGDGAISEAEFTTAALARFDRADADGDGTVTAEERRQQMQERRGGRRGMRG